MASVAQIEHRASSRADGAAFQPILLKVYRAKMLAVAAVLPTKFRSRMVFTLEIQLAQDMIAISTPDGVLPRSEKSSFMFRTEYSHFRCSL
jgi:hypothetical protein